MRHRSPRRARLRWRVPGLALLLAAVLPLPAAPAAAAPVTPVAAARYGPSTLPASKPVPGRAVPAAAEKPSRLAAAAARPARKAVWPVAGAVDVTVPNAGPAAARAGGLPVSVTGPAGRPVRVETLDRAAAAKAGVDGVLLRVSSPSPGDVALTVDPSAFATGGGDEAGRLRLVRLSDGVDVTTKAVPGRLTGTVRIGAAPAIVAVAAVASGSTGDYRATPLSPSASWDVSEQTGDFSWSYPIAVPPVPGGLAPDLSMDYSSGSIDGHVASTNNQPSWVGDGFELGGGYVERGYRGCSDDGVATSGDLCWAADTATLVLGGKATPLVRNDADGTWKPAQDDGETVERLTGATNGDNDGEHWKVTTTDGTQYFFGLNKLPGWTSSANPYTNGTWKVPVYGNGVGEPCHATTWCSQAWRWNLDYVVDPHGNAMAYYYAHEDNRYLARGTTTGYQRGGNLARIDYGFRDGQAYSAQAPAQVVFTLDNRCKTAGATCTLTTANKDNWPDVPVDQVCTATCTTTQKSPTFFSTKRLKQIDTQVRIGTAYTPVDRWTLGQTWPDPGDGTSAALFLASIGHSAGGVTVPDVTFDGSYLPNRVDGLEGLQPLNKWRIGSVRSETGGQLEVNYAPAECVSTALPAAQDTNTRRCFAAWWTPPGEAAQLDWFHKYVIKQTLDRDLVGGGRFTQTDYRYDGGGAWHFADADEVTPVAKRTWSAWRGYAQVTVTTGAGDDGPRTTTESRYYRGMDGDKLTTGTRSATITDSKGGSHADSDGLAGFPLETRTLIGGTEVAGTITDPYRSRTAARAHDGRNTAAYLVRTASQKGRTTLSPGVRTTQVDSTWDAHGNVATVNDLGDTATAADDRCTLVGYAANPTKRMWSYPSTSATVAVACTATPTYPKDAISDTRTYYDASTTLGQVTAGDVSRTDAAKSYTGSTPTYLTTAKATVDGYGRQLTATDAKQRTTTTTYTDTGGLTTQTAVKDPKTYTTTTTLDPTRGLPVTTVDANSRRTDLAYDPLGRLTTVWLPAHPKASYPNNPDRKFAYAVSRTAAAAVTSSTISPDGSYLTSYALFDGLLRPRQTQAVAHDGSGRVVTDTTYNTRGLAMKSNSAYVVAGTAGTGLVQVDDNQVPGQTVTEYDGAGRATVSIFRDHGAEKWRSTTDYRGDHVDVTPVSGGTPTSTWTDARGRTTKLQQYRGTTPTGTGTADATAYTWDGADRLASMTDPAGNRWTWTYDVLGQQTGSTDPDKGATTSTYDDAGQLETVTDARGTTLGYTYDELGRRTGERLGSTTGTLLASWAYDTAAAGKGLPASSTRYAGTDQYTTAITGYATNGEPYGSTVTIPATETGLAGTYRYRMVYKPDGQLQGLDLPITPGLANESLTYLFNARGNQAALEAGLNRFVPGVSYDALGRVARVSLQSGATAVWLSWYRDQPTGRLSNTKVELGNNPTPVSDARYGYDPAGNVTSIADGADTQCYTRDWGQRLTSAWTPSSGSCAAAPTVAGLGGPAPYWQDYTWDTANNRTKLVAHTAAGDTTTTYGYPAAGAAQPHTVRTATVSGPGVSRTDTYGYDATGNTTTRAGKTLSWDAEGRLATVSGSGSNVYDADGNRLIRRDSAGKTLFLPFGVEVRTGPNGENPTSTRYYTVAGQTVAVRTAAGLSFLGADPQGTAQVSIDTATAAATVRRGDPFGVPRGTAPAWPGDRGFVGGTTDQLTATTHLGAREYDPALGRFLSVDPLLDTGDPQSLDGFTYADGDPVTNADPDGQVCRTGPDGASCYDPSRNKHTPVDGGGSGGGSSSGGGSGSSGRSGGGSRSSGGNRDATIALIEEATHGTGPYHDAVTACHYNGACVAKRYTPMPEFHGWPGHQWSLLDKVAFGIFVAVIAVVACVIACEAIAAAAPAVTAAARARMATASIRMRAKPKMPRDWGPGDLNRKKVGVRWQDPSNKGNGVRIDRGDPKNSQPTQQVDHVVVRHGGRVIGRDGKPISGSVKNDSEMSHIPLSEWLKWKTWFRP